MMKVIYTSGVFDLFHIGHLNLLKRARSMGDRLVVGLSTDHFVESYKGSRPVIPYNQRKEILESIKYVDAVIRQNCVEKIRNMVDAGANVIVMGDDWKEKGIMGQETIIKSGKKIVYVPYTKGISTTEIRDWIKNEN